MSINQLPTSDWVSEVTALLNELDDEDVPQKVLSLAEGLVSGYSLNEAAKMAGITQKTATNWLSRYPKLAYIAERGSRLAKSWRMARIEQQFLTAINKSQEILELNLDGTDKHGNDVDPKVLTVVAAQARYVIGLLAAQQRDINVNHKLDETVLNAQRDALDYITQKLMEQDNDHTEPIEVAYTVINPNVDTNVPLLTSQGEPNYGNFGVLDTDEEGTICHVCGKRSKNLISHIRQAHVMTAKEYETIYMLPENALRSIKAEDEDDES